MSCGRLSTCLLSGGQGGRNGHGPSHSGGGSRAQPPPQSLTPAPGDLPPPAGLSRVLLCIPNAQHGVEELRNVCRWTSWGPAGHDGPMRPHPVSSGPGWAPASHWKHPECVGNRNEALPSQSPGSWPVTHMSPGVLPCPGHPPHRGHPACTARLQPVSHTTGPLSYGEHEPLECRPGLPGSPWLWPHSHLGGRRQQV